MTEIQHKENNPLQLANTALNTQTNTHHDNLQTFIRNIIHYQNYKELHPTNQHAEQLRDSLRQQLNLLWFQQKIERFEGQKEKEEVKQIGAFEKTLFEIEEVIRELQYLKDHDASTEQKYINFQSEMNRYVQWLQDAINSDNIKEHVLKGSIFAQDEASENETQSNVNGEIDIPSGHNFLQAINTKINYPIEVFNYIKPFNHQCYITEVAKTYNDIAVYKLKNIALSLTEGPVISRPNFFQEGLEQSKAVLHYCIPGTNKVAFYSMADVVRTATISKDYYQERTLSNEWLFSQYTKSVITPNGKIFAINCRSTKDKIDPYFYEISESKASNRGPLMAAKRDATLVYMSGCVYLIGGRGQGQKCSKKNYKYSIKEKKWTLMYESNIALSKATVCTVNNRYICKVGGLNQFDYINKTIELYDSLTDRWSLARCSPRNILQEITILEDSNALQISDDQIYIFGGKNGNKFSTDTGFVLLISQIKEKRKGAAKVSGQFWNVSVGKRNILTFFGTFTSTAPLIQHNVIYGLRTQVCKALSI